MPQETPPLFDITHATTVKGCMTWGRSQIIKFEQNHKITWLSSKMKDILFNSVLDVDLSLPTFSTSLSQITQHYTDLNLPVAWLISDRNQINNSHQELFLRHNYEERNGTTGMYLSTQEISDHPINSKSLFKKKDAYTLQQVTTDQELFLWAHILFTNYNFPIHYAKEWGTLHKEIGYRDKDYWNHFIAYDHSKKKPVAIGTASFFQGDSPEESSLANLSTIPEYRGQGVATYLAYQLISILAKSGYTVTSLYAADNAISIYEKIGFKKLYKNTFFILNQ